MMHTVSSKTSSTSENIERVPAIGGGIVTLGTWSFDSAELWGSSNASRDVCDGLESDALDDVVAAANCDGIARCGVDWSCGFVANSLAMLLSVCLGSLARFWCSCFSIYIMAELWIWPDGYIAFIITDVALFGYFNSVQSALLLMKSYNLVACLRLNCVINHIIEHNLSCTYYYLNNDKENKNKHWVISSKHSVCIYAEHKPQSLIGINRIKKVKAVWSQQSWWCWKWRPWDLFGLDDNLDAAQLANGIVHVLKHSFLLSCAYI